ncbi:hypothetical protein B0H14DRAFT_2613193 [Mycena olivaceomarginata]|nr:hypothetical protein B0H14DRAFT_2613193 [Mycena olivaceomarginata]
MSAGPSITESNEPPDRNRLTPDTVWQCSECKLPVKVGLAGQHNYDEHQESTKCRDQVAANKKQEGGRLSLTIPTGPPRIVHQVLMLDEIAVEKRACWDNKTNMLQRSGFGTGFATRVRRPKRGVRHTGGAGKTVLASIVVNDLENNPANESNRVVVLYLDHQETTEHSLTNLLAAIWHQLSYDRPLSSNVIDLYKKHHVRHTRPTCDVISTLLRSTISEFSGVFIIVDGLDEYPEDDRETLVQSIWELGSAVRLMVTSRPHININHLISNIEIVDVRAAEDDIRKYVEGRISKSSRFRKHGDSKLPMMRQLIEERIVKRSDGMFLLAKLNIDSLMTEPTVADVLNALADLSSNLDGAYDDIVRRIDRGSEKERQLAWRTLFWVLNAKTPLRPSQLKEALIVEPNATNLDSNRHAHIDLILRVCSGFISIDEADDKVRLVHYTTKIYLERSDHVRACQAHMFPFPQSDLTLICMTYMSLTFKQFPHLLQHEFLLFTRNPFLHYAVEYCLKHARGDPETHIKQLILSFLANCYDWWRLWNWKHGGRPSAPDQLWIAITFGLEVLCKHIINEHGAGNLLQQALSRGDMEAVKILIRNGVKLKSEGGALLEAVIHGHEELIPLLLAHGANNNPPAMNSTALRGRGDAGSLGTTLHEDKGHNWHDIALYEASWRGNEGIVKLLVQHGANVNANGGKYGGALGAAVWKGHQAVAQVLIQHGADVHATAGDQYCSLLQAAVWEGNDNMVQLLLDHGADVNADGGWYGSALQVASRLGHKSIVRVLLEHGADINAVGGVDGSALMAAVGEGHDSIVQLLLEWGAGADMKQWRDHPGATIRSPSPNPSVRSRTSSVGRRPSFVRAVSTSRPSSPTPSTMSAYRRRSSVSDSESIDGRHFTTSLTTSVPVAAIEPTHTASSPSSNKSFRSRMGGVMRRTSSVLALSDSRPSSPTPKQQKEANAALVAQNEAYEMEFRAARQALANIGLRPPKSWVADRY